MKSVVYCLIFPWPPRTHNSNICIKSYVSFYLAVQIYDQFNLSFCLLKYVHIRSKFRVSTQLVSFSKFHNLSRMLKNSLIGIVDQQLCYFLYCCMFRRDRICLSSSAACQHISLADLGYLPNQVFVDIFVEFPQDLGSPRSKSQTVRYE